MMKMKTIVLFALLALAALILITVLASAGGKSGAQGDALGRDPETKQEILPADSAERPAPDGVYSAQPAEAQEEDAPDGDTAEASAEDEDAPLGENETEILP